MKLRSVFLLALVLCLVFTMVACSGNDAKAPEPSASAPAEEPKPEYPKKPITMIVPYGAGGTTDLTGRQSFRSSRCQDCS